MELMLNAWVAKYDYFTAQPELRELVKNTLDKAGVEIPFPQVVVHKSEK